MAGKYFEFVYVTQYEFSISLMPTDILLVNLHVQSKHGKIRKNLQISKISCSFSRSIYIFFKFRGDMSTYGGHYKFEHCFQIWKYLELFQAAI